MNVSVSPSTGHMKAPNTIGAIPVANRGGRRSPPEPGTAQASRVQLGDIGVEGRDRDLDDEAEADDRCFRSQGEFGPEASMNIAAPTSRIAARIEDTPSTHLRPNRLDDQCRDHHAEDANCRHRPGDEEGRLIGQALLLEDSGQPCQCRVVDKEDGDEE